MGLLNLRQSMVSYLKVLFRSILCSLARLPTDTARVFFPSHSLEKRALSLSSPFSSSRICPMPQQDFFTLSFAQLRKILS